MDARAPCRRVLLALLLAVAAAVPAAAPPKPSQAARPNVRANPGRFRVKAFPSVGDPAFRKLSGQGSVTALYVYEQPIVKVPNSFLGLSLDLNDIEGIGHPDFIGIIKHLTELDTGPMYMRVGAESADRLTKPWPGTVYKAMTDVNKATGMMYIVGVNQHAEDPALTASQVKRSLKLLPAGSIASFAVGNEPDMYTLQGREGLPGISSPKESNWLGNKWISVSKVIYKAAYEAAGWKRMLGGPDWSDSHLEDKKLAWWLHYTKDYLNMVTVHHYGGNILKDTSIQGLLNDERMVKKISNLKNLIKVCRDYGNLPLRVTEVATLSYGGVMGISDTAGAALWALDTALEIAFTGAAGVHFHQVLTRQGNANYNAIYYQADKNRVRVRQPLYGYLMVQQALSGGADIVGRQIRGDCKVWLLKGRKRGDLRIVVLNKADGRDCAADVRLNVEQLRRFAPMGDAQYMFAAGGLKDRWRIYYSDSFFDVWGSDRQRPPQTVPVPRYLTRDRGGKVDGGGFAVQLTSGTIASLIAVPLSSAADQKAFDQIRWAAPKPAAPKPTQKGGKAAAPQKGRITMAPKKGGQVPAPAAKPAG